MKKLISLIILFCIFWSGQVYAVNVSPASGTKSPGSSETITILAAPQTGSDSTAIVRLTLTNATVTSYANGPYITIGACSGGASFVSTHVCVDISKGSAFTNGETLGSFTIHWGSAGSATIVRDNDNGYYNGTTTTLQGGTAGTYTISGSSPTSTPVPGSHLPATALADDINVGNLIIVGVGVVVVAVILAVVGYNQFKHEAN